MIKNQYTKDYKQQCVDASSLINCQQHGINHLTCCICLQIMTHPFVADCQGNGAEAKARHVFGISCINSWIQKSGKKCPLCRNSFQTLEPANELTESIKKLLVSCKQCQKILPATEMNCHLRTCEKRIEYLKLELKEVVEKQIFWLQKQINPHVRYSHSQIYLLYVQEWQWLYHDTRNWKWWWWASNPWWEYKSCPTCNTLWHKYQKQIDAQQVKRIKLISQINLPEQEKQQEKVQCKND